jgi:hypothetical protein
LPPRAAGEGGKIVFVKEFVELGCGERQQKLLLCCKRDASVSAAFFKPRSQKLKMPNFAKK